MFSDLKGARFGETTLNELRRTLGNNGFCYVERGCTISIQDGIALFNSYEIEGNPDVIATFVTLVIGSPTNQEVGDQAKLDGIIIGYRKYLDGIWGERKVFDKAYKPIIWP